MFLSGANYHYHGLHGKSIYMSCRDGSLRCSLGPLNELYIYIYICVCVCVCVLNVWRADKILKWQSLFCCPWSPTANKRVSFILFYILGRKEGGRRGGKGLCLPLLYELYMFLCDSELSFALKWLWLFWLR